MFKEILFEDRKEAGKKLANALTKFSNKKLIVLAIPRGGVVVGYEVAEKLSVPLDVIVPRKLRAPNQPELAIGAVTEDGTIILDKELANSLNISDDYINSERKRQKLEIERRLLVYKEEKKIIDLTGFDVIVVDDGIATGATMEAALVSVRKRGAKAIILAVPVASSSSLNMLKKWAVEIVCLYTPSIFFAIGQFYRNFEQTTDEEVKSLLRKNRTSIISEKTS